MYQLDIPRELARLIRESPNLRDLLDRAVTLVAQRMNVEVCSIYLLDPADQRLWLVASHGFRPEAVGETSLSLDEGLSMSSASIPEVKNAIRGVSHGALRRAARELLSIPAAKELRVAWHSILGRGVV